MSGHATRLFKHSKAKVEFCGAKAGDRKIAAPAKLIDLTREGMAGSATDL